MNTFKNYYTMIIFFCELMCCVNYDEIIIVYAYRALTKLCWGQQMRQS